MSNPNSYIANQSDVEEFLEELKEILNSENCELDILPKKKQEAPNDPYTTENTMLSLDYDTEDVKNELKLLCKEDYIETIIDNKNSSKPPFWVFGKEISSKEIYIKVKIRNKERNKVFCVSFHYARFALKNRPFK